LSVQYAYVLVESHWLGICFWCFGN